MHDPVSKLKQRDTTNKPIEVLASFEAALLERLLPPFLKALQVILASESSTSGHWTAATDEEDKDCCWLSPAELADVAAMRI